MSFEVASAHVSIFPKIASGFGKEIKSAFSGAKGAADSAGRESGLGFGSLFKATLLAQLGAAAIGKVFSGVAGVVKGAFKGGFDRLMNIEQAEIKLKTLALTSKEAAGLTGKALEDFAQKSVKASMDSVSAAVDGTKFAISDAADMAATLGAAGIKAGAGMTRWLTLTADAAQFNNSSFADMQLVIGKVAQQGRVTGEVFNQLPLAAAALADHLGVSQDEVRKLASKGKISAEQFAAALEKKIGGAAKNAGASFGSMVANIRTALNATMAKLIEPFTKAAMPIMAALLPMVKGFRDNVAGPIGANLTKVLVPAADRFAKKLQKIPATFSALSTLLRGEFTPAVRAALGVEEDSPLVKAVFGARRGFIAARGAVRVFAAATKTAFGEIAGGWKLARAGLGSGTSVFSRLGAAAQVASRIARKALDRINAGFKDLKEGWRLAASGLGTGTITTLFGLIGAKAREGFTEARGGLRAFVSAWKAGDGDITSAGFPGFMEAAAYRIRTAWEKTRDSIRDFSTKVKAAFDGVNVDSLRARFGSIFDRIKAGARAALDGIKSFANGFAEGFGGLEGLASRVDELWLAVSGPLGLIRDGFLRAFDPRILDGFDPRAIGKKVGETLGGLIDAYGAFASKATAGITDGFAAALPAARRLGADLLRIITGLVDDIARAFGDVPGAVGEALGAVARESGKLFAALQPTISAIAGRLAPVLRDLVDRLGPRVAEFFTNMAQLIEAVRPGLEVVLIPLLEQLGRTVETVLGFISGTVTGTLDTINGYVSAFAALLAGDWEGLWTGLQQVAEGQVQLITTIVETFLNGTLNLFGTTWAEVSAAASAAWTSISTYLAGVWAGIAATAVTTWTGFVAKLRALWANAVSMARALWSALTGFFATLWAGIRGITSTLWGGIVAFIASIPGRVFAGLAALGQLGVMASEWFAGFLRAAQAKFSEAVAFVASIPSRILGALGNLGGTLAGSGRALIDGFIGGIKRGFDAAKKAVSDGLSVIRQFFPFSPAKRGPFSGKGYTTFSGRKLMEDFGVGITAGQSKAVAAGNRAMSALAAGFKGGKSTASKAAAATAKKIAQDNVKAAEEIDKAFAATVAKVQTAQVNVAKILSRDYWAAVAGSAKQATTALNRIVDELSKIGIPKTSALAKYVTKERDNLTKILATRDQMLARIKTANANLSKLLEEQKKFVDGVYADAFDLGKLIDAKSATDMVKGLKDQIAATKAFNSNLIALRKLGISDNLLEQFAAAGVEKGGAAAAALLKGGAAAVKEVTKLEAQLSAESKRLATSLGNQLYGAGINAAKGLLAGLQSQHSALVKQAQALAVAIHTAIKKELKIKSPSKVTGELGAWTGKGLWQALLGQVSSTEAAARRLAKAAVPRVGATTVPAPNLTAPRGLLVGDVTQNITMQAPAWVHDLETLLAFLKSLGVRAHQMRGAEG